MARQVKRSIPPMGQARSKQYFNAPMGQAVFKQKSTNGSGNFTLYTTDEPGRVKTVSHRGARQGQINKPPMGQSVSQQYNASGPSRVKAAYHRRARQGLKSIRPMGQEVSKQYTADESGRFKQYTTHGPGNQNNILPMGTTNGPGREKTVYHRWAR